MLPRILILSGEPECRNKISRVMPNCGCVPVRCETISAAKGLITRHQIEVIICDDVLPDGDFLELIRELRRSACEAQVVVMSRSYGDWGAYLDAIIARRLARETLQKWEYQIVGCGVGCSGQVAQINKLGDEGWEVVTLNASNRILLKRAK